MSARHLGFAVFSTTSHSHLDVSAIHNQLDGSDDCEKHCGLSAPSELAGLVAANWKQSRALYRATLQVLSHPELEMVHIYSFGCGVDALATMQLRELLEDSNRIYTALKIDEMVDLAAIRIRLRSLAAALRERELADDQFAQVKQQANLGSSPVAAASGNRVIVVPALAPEHLNAIRPIMAAEGIKLEVLDPIDQQDIETGQRYCDNDLCHPMIALAGQVIRWASESAANDLVTVLIPQVCSGCRSIELETIVRRALWRNGVGQHIEIIGFPGTGSQTS